MRRRNGIGALVVLAIIVCQLSAGLASAAEVRVLPTPVAAIVGDAVSLAVTMDSATDLSGFQFKFAYDPAVLEVTAIAVNPGFDRQFRQVFNNGTGSGVVAAVALNNPSLSTAPLILATINFRAKGPGASDVNLMNLVLGRNDGEEVLSTVFSGHLSVASITPPVSTITGAPASLTNQTGATLTVGGAYVVAYKYKLDAGIYSAETATTSAIILTGLSEGSHTVSVIGRDASGNWQLQADATTATWAVDMTIPALSVSTLANGSYTNNNMLNVAGICSDANGIQSLLVSNETVTINPDNTFSHLVTLLTGSNIITTVATDVVGNQSTDTRTIILDQTAPLLAIITPADNSITNQVLSTVTGTVEANALVKVKVNSGSAAAALQSGATFTYTATLAAGINTIDVTATDLANNTSSAKRTVTYDSVAPGIAILVPNQDSITTTGSVQVQGTVTDSLTTATVSLFDGTNTYVPLISNGTFSQTITFSAEGQHVITATATDEAGNQSSAQRNIKYIKWGDLDSNGTVNSIDALRALRIAAGLIQPTATDLSRGDVAPLVSGTPKPDGKIDLGDVVVILRKAVGLVSW